MADPATAAMADILQALQSSNNDDRNRAEQAFNAAKQQPGPCLTSLVALATSHQDEVVRATASVLLRRSVADIWERADTPVHNAVKTSLLSAIRTEPRPHLRKKLSDIVATLGSTLVPAGAWNELLPFVLDLSRSPIPTERESSLYIFSQIAEHIAEVLSPHVDTLHAVFQAGLADASLEVSIAALRASCAIINSLETEAIRGFGDLVPQMLGPVSASLNAGDEESARTCIELMIETMDYEPKFWKPHVAMVFEAMRQVASSTGLDESTRQLALEFMVSSSETLPSVCRKIQNFTSTVFPLALNMMLELEDDPEWYQKDDEEDDSGEYTMFDAGQEALDRLSIALGGKTVLPVAFQIIPGFLQNQTSWVHRHAALLAISQIGEGCSVQIQEQLAAVLKMPLGSLQDPHPRVRWAAINCVGQMCTDFGPSIQNDHHTEILPSLTTAMDDAGNPRVQSHAAAAIINFCDEAAPEMIAAYLEPLLGRLMLLLQSPQRIIQEQAVTAVAAVADAAEKNFLPYYDTFMPNLKTVLTMAAGQKELRRLRGKVMECISLIGLSVGREKFALDAASVMDVLVRTQGSSLESDDPQSFYLMQAYARICRCLKEDFIPYLPYVMPGLLEAAGQKPDIEIINDDGEDQEDDDDDGVERIRIGNKTIGIRTSALEDKATACSMISCFISELKGGFIQYVEPVTKLMIPLLMFFYHDEVRSAAAGCLPDLVRAVKAQGPQMEAQTKQLVEFIWPTLLDATSKEPDLDVLTVMAESLGDIVDLLSSGMLGPQQLTQVTDMVLSLLADRKERIIERQADAVESGWDEEEMEDNAVDAEKDDEILARLVDVVEALFRTHSSAGFLQCFVQDSSEGSLVQEAAAMLGQDRPATEKHAGLCIFAELVDCGGESYADRVLPAMSNYMTDEDPDVRQAASYGMGVCAEKAGTAFRNALSGPQFFQTVHAIVGQPNSRTAECEGATDNAVSSLGRVLEFQRDMLGEELAGAIRLWLAYLPVRGDIAEALLNHARLLRFVEAGDEFILGPSLSNLPQILRILGEVSLLPNILAADAAPKLVVLVKLLKEKFPDATASALGALAQDTRRQLEVILGS